MSSAIVPYCHLSLRPPIPLPEEEEDEAESETIQDGAIEDQQYENEVSLQVQSTQTLQSHLTGSYLCKVYTKQICSREMTLEFCLKWRERDPSGSKSAWRKSRHLRFTQPQLRDQWLSDTVVSAVRGGERKRARVWTAEDFVVTISIILATGRKDAGQMNRMCGSMAAETVLAASSSFLALLQLHHPLCPSGYCIGSNAVGFSPPI